MYSQHRHLGSSTARVRRERKPNEGSESECGVRCAHRCEVQVEEHKTGGSFLQNSLSDTYFGSEGVVGSCPLLCQGTSVTAQIWYRKIWAKFSLFALHYIVACIFKLLN